MIIRELVAMFGISTDPKGFKEADKRTDELGSRIKGTLANLGIAFGVGAAFHFAREMVDMASTVSETMNVVNTSFGDNAERVVSWAESSGEAMGRARSQMLGFSAGLGAMIQPMIGSREKAADMSTTLAELAVDLGSFFNVADEDALQAIKAGLIGSTEPMMKFGVVMNDVALKAYALEKGIKKKYEKMSQAEKVGLRYQFMLEKTADAQGDAVKTAGGYANRVKALNAGITNLKETLGTKLLPVATKIVQWAIDGAKAFGDLATHSRALEASLYVAAAALLPFAINAAIAAAPVVILAAGFVAITAIVGEFLKLLDGQANVIDDFFVTLYGKAKWDSIKSEWAAGFGALKLIVADFWAFLKRGNDEAPVDPTNKDPAKGNWYERGVERIRRKWAPWPVSDNEAEPESYPAFFRKFYGLPSLGNGAWMDSVPSWQASGTPGAGLVQPDAFTIQTSVVVQGNATPDTAREVGRQVNAANRDAIVTTRKVAP